MTYIQHFKSVAWNIRGEEKNRKNPVIAISGLSGSGKDTYSELLKRCSISR